MSQVTDKLYHSVLSSKLRLSGIRSHNVSLTDLVFTFRDRFRSITNLFAHALGVVVTYHFSASVLTDRDDDDEAENLNVFDAEIIVSE